MKDAELQNKPYSKKDSNGRLELTEDNYRTIFENSAVAITVTNQDEKIVSWNRFTETLLGMNGDDLYMMPVKSLYPEEEWQKIRQQNVRQKGMQHHFETKIIRKDRQIIDVAISLSVLKGKDGAIHGSIGIIADISEQKRAAEALQRSKELFEKTFNSQPNAIFILDAQIPPVILDCNKASTEIFGYSREEMLGRTTTFLHVDEAALREFQKQLFPSIKKSGFLHLPEFHMKRSDGTVFPTENTVVPLKNDAGERIGWISLVQDITERKQSEEALRRSEGLSRGMLEIATTGIYLLNRGRFVYVNRLMEEMLGYTSSELIGTEAADYIHPEDREAVRARAIEALKGQNNLPHEFRVVRKDLDIIWVSGRVKSIEYEGNHATLGTLIDITERKMAEALSQERTKQIETMFSISTAAGQTLNLTELLEVVLQKVFEVIPVKSGGIFLVDKQSNELVLKTQRGFSSDFAQRVSRMKIGKGFAGRVAQSGKLAIVGNLSTDRRFDPVFLDGEGLQSICSVPIMAKDEILGVISVGSHNSRRFHEREIRLLSSIATQIGIAIENAQLYEKTVEMAFNDDVTVLYNRRYFLEELERDLARARRKGTPLSLLMMDMDGLKSINDRFGHDRGAAFIKELGNIIKANTRASDVAARFGGDEFVLLAAETDTDEAVEIAERLRLETSSYSTQIEGWEVGMSISVGVATFPKHASESEGLIKRADQAMYEAKRAGKNRTCVAKPIASPDPTM
jgi:diguanylate cyclase (GGDEF)-like protein/PAS domain S-box-containing protein